MVDGPSMRGTFGSEVWEVAAPTDVIDLPNGGTMIHALAREGVRPRPAQTVIYPPGKVDRIIVRPLTSP